MEEVLKRQVGSSRGNNVNACARLDPGKRPRCQVREVWFARGGVSAIHQSPQAGAINHQTLAESQGILCRQLSMQYMESLRKLVDSILGSIHDLYQMFIKSYR